MPHHPSCNWSRRTAVRIGASALAVMSATAVQAQTATQTVRFSVVMAPRTAMSASSPAFSTQPRSVAGVSTRASIAGSSYAFSTNESNQKIAASLNEPMPRGITLAASLMPPVGAWSAGATSLGNTARDVIGGVSRASAEALPLEYTYSARGDMPRVNPKRVVTFTITGGV